MANYSIFSDVSAFLVNALRQKLCPELTLDPMSIDCVDPADSSADYILGVCLYDIRESGDFQSHEMVFVDEKHQKYPPKAYSLSYMVYVNADSRSGLKPLDAQKILGRAAQVIADLNGIGPDLIHEGDTSGDELINLMMERLDLEQKQRIWSGLNRPYTAALYYTVYPVSIYSERIVTTTRVKSTHFRYRAPQEGEAL